MASEMRPATAEGDRSFHFINEQQQHLIFRSHQQSSSHHHHHHQLAGSHHRSQHHRSSVGPINLSAASASASSGATQVTISRAHSVVANPVRKISATDFESRTGSGFLGPIISTTPDGRPTFMWHPPLFSQQDCSNLQNAVSSSGSSINQQENLQRNRAAISGSDVTSDTKSGDSASERIIRGISSSDSGEASHHSATREDEVERIFELVKNIYDDLDIRTLLHKILRNIAVLINADKSSLFLVCGDHTDPNRHLVSHLFNVDQESELDELGEMTVRRVQTMTSRPSPVDGNAPPFIEDNCIRIPWGTGLVGYVAESGESVNIENCYEDPRFTDAIDQRTGYLTKNMLCAPIYDKRDEIVGVAQVINKRNGERFSENDEIKFKRYLQFCGIGLRNAQSYEQCQLENKRNQVLLDLARMVFEEQSTIEQVVYRIMLHTQSLLDCERCQVLLIDDGSDDLDQLHQMLQLPLSTNGGLANSHQLFCNKRGSLAATGACPNVSSTEISQCAAPPWRPQCCNLNQEAEALPPNIRFDVQAAISEGQASNVVVPVISYEASDPQEDEARQVNEADRPQARHQLSSPPPPPKLFSLIFDLECNDGSDPVVHNSKDKQQATETHRGDGGKFPINIGITGYVAMTGETLNIEDAHQHEKFDPSVDDNSNFKHKSILCMPIRNGQRQIIGVIQLINKKNGKPFNKNDENLFEAFAIFCGLGIHNTLMYEKVLKIMAKQRVTFEVLSYHATAPLEEAKKLHKEQIPSCYSLDLASFKFNDFSLDEQYMLKSCLRFFLDLDLIRRFQIDQLVFCQWILSVQKNYRKVTYHPIVGGTGLKAAPVRYHNWRHAFNVTQMMFAILVNTQICQVLGELETLALLIACLCHDLDHRGTNNSFQIKSASPLAELYSTSTMEHHHFDQCVMILNSQGNQILANLSPSEYARVIVLLEEAILATDLANYFMKRDRFFQLVNSNQFDWKHNTEHRSLLRCMLMTACDVAAITKPWPVQKVVADLVMSEFYQQGDIEKNELKIQPIDMMNRDKMSELPEMQISFIDTICAPIYTAFDKLFPRELRPLIDGCLSNRNLWAEMAQKNSSIRNNNNENVTSNDNISGMAESGSPTVTTDTTSIANSILLNNYLNDETMADRSGYDIDDMRDRSRRNVSSPELINELQGNGRTVEQAVSSVIESGELANESTNVTAAGVTGGQQNEHPLRRGQCQQTLINAPSNKTGQACNCQPGKMLPSSIEQEERQSRQQKERKSV